MSAPPDPWQVLDPGEWPARLVTDGPLLALDLPRGRVAVRLRGLNRSGYQHKLSLVSAGLPAPEEEFAAWRRLWNAQALRLPLALDALLESEDYRAGLRRLVDAAEQAGLFLLLELHGLTSDLERALPPLPEALEGWRLLAAEHGARAHVVFDLWNEPHDVAWDEWQPLAQALVEAVRAGGAERTLVLVGGLDWAFDLSPLERPEARLDGLGGPLAYAAHVYPWKGGFLLRRRAWQRAFAGVACELPVLVTELGVETWPRPRGLPRSWARAWLRDLLAFLDERGLSGLAWSAGDQPHLVHGGGGQDVCLPDCPPDPAQPTEPGALVRHWLRRGGSTA